MWQTVLTCVVIAFCLPVGVRRATDLARHRSFQDVDTAFVHVAAATGSRCLALSDSPWLVANFGYGMGSQSVPTAYSTVWEKQRAAKSFFGVVDAKPRVPRNNGCCRAHREMANRTELRYDDDMLNFGALTPSWVSNAAAVIALVVREQKWGGGGDAVVVVPPVLRLCIASIWLQAQSEGSKSPAASGWPMDRLRAEDACVRGDLVNFDLPRRSEKRVSRAKEGPYSQHSFRASRIPRLRSGMTNLKRPGPKRFTTDSAELTSTSGLRRSHAWRDTWP